MMLHQHPPPLGASLGCQLILDASSTEGRFCHWPVKSSSGLAASARRLTAGRVMPSWRPASAVARLQQRMDSGVQGPGSGRRTGARSEHRALQPDFRSVARVR